MACIAGSIAQAYYKAIPQKVVDKVRERLPEEFLQILDEFHAAYGLM